MRKFPKNAVKERRMLSADKEVESCCNLPYNEAEHIRSSNAFVYLTIGVTQTKAFEHIRSSNAFVCVTPIVKFVAAIISPSKARNSFS